MCHFLFPQAHLLKLLVASCIIVVESIKYSKKKVYSSQVMP